MPEHVLYYTKLYKSSHAVFYDRVRTYRLVVLNPLKKQSIYNFSMIILYDSV